MIKNDIIVINSFPNNEEKLMLLVEQLGYLTKLNKPILLISGCPVPEFIESKVEYLFINTENEVIGKDFSYFLVKNGIQDFAYEFFKDGTMRVDFYWPNVNSTIAKNIKLGFELAKSLGYKTVFYTEDDNIWKDGSFSYIEHNLSQISSGDYKITGVLGNQHGSYKPMIFTTFFFADVDYFLSKFIIPVNAKEWYDIDNVKKYYLYRTFEEVFYHLFKNELNLFYNSEPMFLEMVGDDPNDRKKFGWGVYNRRNSEKNLINTFFTVLPSNTKDKNLMLNNQSRYLKSGAKTYKISIEFDGNFDSEISVSPDRYHVIKLPEYVQTVTLNIDGYGTVNLDASWEVINNNGYITFDRQTGANKDAIKPNEEAIDFLVGGRMGDFIQVLYVVQQYYEQTGKKGNVYITDDLRYGGDIFTRPLKNLYEELFPIIIQQEYINKFEIFDNQTNNFINLNDWRLPEYLKQENFPWIDLFTKTYLQEFKNLTHKAWIKYSGIDLSFKDKVVIHRTHRRVTENEVNWEQLIKDNKCIFVAFDETPYNEFPYKDMLPFHKIDSLSEYCSILNSCKFYVGNLTGPTSIAHAMDIPRLIELCDIDSIHYITEERYFKELNWISNIMPKPILRTVNNHIKYEPLYTHRT